MRGKCISILMMCLALVLSCQPDEVEPEVPVTPDKPVRTAKTFTVALPEGQEFSGDLPICIFIGSAKNRFTREGTEIPAVFKDTCVSSDVYHAVYPYDSKITADQAGIHLILDTEQKVSAGSVPASPFYVGSSSDGTFSLSGIVTPVKFTVKYDNTVSVVLKSLSGDGLAGPVTLVPPVSEGAWSVKADSLSLSLKADGGFLKGEYYANVAAVNYVAGLQVVVTSADGTVSAVPVGTNGGLDLRSGGVCDLGVIDEAFAPKLSAMVVPVRFKQTGEGSSWPFVEDSGKADAHARNSRLHLAGSGYPVIWTGGGYYLDQDGGFKYESPDPGCYFEFPTFAKGRVVSVSAAFGSTPSPYLTDRNGEVIPGGEAKSGIQAGTLVEWTLGDTEFGEPVRFVMGSSEGSILQFNVTYEMLEGEILNGIESVTVSDGGNKTFGKDRVDINAAVTFKPGASGASSRCVIEYRDAADSGPYTVVECTPENFSCTIDRATGDKYDVRAWAMSSGGWRVYADELTAYSACLRIDFWVDGKLNQPFTVNMPAGATAGQAQAGKEQVWTLKDTDVSIATFSPLTPEGCYIDVNSARACRIISSGTETAPCTYFKLPAVPGKALREVVVTRGISPGARFMICEDPDNAQATAVSSVLYLGSEGSTGTLSCPLTSANTAYYLVFPEQKAYNLCNAHAFYENSSSSGPGASDEPGPGALFTEEPDDPSVDVKRTFDYSVLAKAGHPRLLMGREDFSKLKARVTDGRLQNPTLYKIHSAVVAHAGKIASSGDNLTDPAKHEQVVEHLLALSYAYRMTGRAEYLAKLRSDLRTVTSWTDWNSSNALSYGEICQAVAIAYDWLYYDLDLEERTRAHEAMVRNAIRISLNDGYRAGRGNGNQVINSGVMLGALAIYEKDKAVAVDNIEAGLVDNKACQTVVYAGGGGYPEGSNYWEYGTTNEVILLQTLEHIFGHTAGLGDVPGFMDTGSFALFAHGTANSSFSFNDGGGAVDDPLPGTWWFAAKKGDPSLAFGEKHLLDKGVYTTSFQRRMPLVPCFLKDFDIDSKTIQAPSEAMWHCGGQMPVGVVRRGWKYDASDAYLCVKGGHADTWASMVTSHGHMDAGSFIFEADGQRWSDDIMRPSYSAWFAALRDAGSRSGDTSQSGLRWDTFRVNNLCHSTISAYANDGSVPGKLHPSDQYVSGQADIVAVIDQQGRQGYTLDLSSPMKGQVKSARRTVCLVDGKDLEVTDEIEALPGLDCPLEWRMLSVSIASVSDGKVVLTSLADASVSRELKVSCSDSSVNPEYASWSTVRPSSWTPRTWDPVISDRVIAGWKVTLPAGRKVTFTTTFRRP